MECKNLTLSTYSRGSSVDGSNEGRMDQMVLVLSSGCPAPLSAAADMAFGKRVPLSRIETREDRCRNESWSDVVIPLSNEMH